MAKSTKQHWDTFWSDGSKPSDPNRKIVDTITALGGPSGWTTLEVGAGRGADSVYLARHGATSYVLDYSRTALDTSEELARREGVELSLIEADARNIPFPDDTFDLIFHQGFLEHFRNPGDFLREQRRVLKPGGYLLADVPQKYTLYTLRKQWAIRRGTWFAGWETQFGPRQLEKIVRDSGFTIIGSYAWGMTASYGWGVRNAIHRLKSALRPGAPVAATKHEVQQVSEAGAAPGFTSPRPLLYLADCIGVVARK